MNRIIGDYNTIFGRAIVLIPERQYQTGDQIELDDGHYRITQVIPPSYPMDDGRISLVIEKIAGYPLKGRDDKHESGCMQSPEKTFEHNESGSGEMAVSAHQTIMSIKRLRTLVIKGF